MIATSKARKKINAIPPAWAIFIAAMTLSGNQKRRSSSEETPLTDTTAKW